MPLFDFQCTKCLSKLLDVIVKSLDEKVKCPKCGKEMRKLVTTWGGYKIKGDNSGSVTPRGAGSKR